MNQPLCTLEDMCIELVYEVVYRITWKVWKSNEIKAGSRKWVILGNRKNHMEVVRSGKLV